MSDETDGGRAASAGERVEPPLLRVITPGATDEEIAALVAVVSAMAGAGGDAPAPPRRVWSAPSRLHRSSPASGPGAWRASGLPR